MLIKARVSAGDREPGERLLDFVEPLIYQSSLDFRAVEAVSETRQRISEKMAARRSVAGGLDVKLTPGGIRDIEFLVQCLQRLHGGREPWVRHGGTMLALSRLRDKGLLSGGEYARLAAAYQFLRNLEHRLQLEEDRQTHTLPTDPDRLQTAGAEDACRRPPARFSPPPPCRTGCTNISPPCGKSTIVWCAREAPPAEAADRLHAARANCSESSASSRLRRTKLRPGVARDSRR